MTETVRADVAVKILERAARGQSWLRIGRELAVPATTAEWVALTFGYPSASHMRSAVNNLTGLGRELVTYGPPDDDAAPPAHAERPLSLEARQREEAPELSPAELIEQTVRALSVDQLLERAAASGRGSLRADAARVPQLLERMRAALIADEKASQTRARVAELRRELAQLERSTGTPRERLECSRLGCDYSTVQPARFAAHTATHEETPDA